MRDFWLLKWLARLVYGIVLPTYLLFFSISSHYHIQLERQRTGLIEAMGHRLDYLANYYSDEKFFHSLLQENFARADKSSQPIAGLEKMIAGFKRKFDQKLRFVVADSRCNIIKSLSDEKRYSYVIRLMLEIVERLHLHLQKRQPLVPETDSAIVGKIALLRTFFGTFLMEKHLNLPLLKGYLGSCLRASQEVDKGLIWYQKYDNFFVICFVNKSLLNRELGARMICAAQNHDKALQKLGFYKVEDFSVNSVPFDESIKTEIAYRAREFALSALPTVESDKILLVFRQVSPKLVLFSCIEKKQGLTDPVQESERAFLQSLKWVAIILFVGYCYFLRQRDFYLTIRQKMLLLFLFANGLPLLILVSTGYEFFEQKKQTMINSINNQSARFLKDYDNRFPSYISALSGQLNNFIEKDPVLNSRVPENSEIKPLKNFVAGLKPDEGYLFLGEKDLIVNLKDEVVFSLGFLRDLFRNALALFNESGFVYKERKKTSLEMISDETAVFSDFLESNDKIFLQNYGSGNRWTYVRLMGNLGEYKSWGVLVVTWKPETIMRRFFAESIDRVNSGIWPRRLVLMDNETETVFPAELSNEGSVRRIMHRTKSRKLINEQNLEIAGKKWVASSMTGMELSNAVLMSLFPLDLVEQSLKSLFYQIGLAVFVSFVFMLLIVKLYSGYFAQPLQLLSTGVSEIGRRNFDFRVEYEPENEFGTLIKGFNEAVSGMKELAVGTAVQESLLPAEHARFGRMKLFARSIFMNRMGGDYFDYFSNRGGALTLFFGDVAGHGIPAAIAMSMAKSVFAGNFREEQSPASLLTKANSVFLYLKEKGWRRMMTALSINLDCDTGKFVCANAGQCFPVIVGAEGKSVRYVKALGMPLGTRLKKDYSEMEDLLQPGETLVLYTDGIIEATDADGDVFDFTRFEALLMNSWHKDLDIYWQGIFAAYKAWAETQDDDITFLMVRYE